MNLKGFTNIGHAISFSIAVEGFIMAFTAHCNKFSAICKISRDFHQIVEIHTEQIKKVQESITFSDINYEDFSKEKVIEVCQKLYKGNTKLIEQIDKFGLFGKIIIDNVEGDIKDESNHLWKNLNFRNPLVKLSFQTYFKSYLKNTEVQR